MRAVKEAVLRRSGQVLGTGRGSVLVDVPAACGACASPCLGGLLQSGSRQMAVADAAAHTLGSAVELVVEKSGLTRACSLVFGLPLLGLLIGAGIVGEMNGAAAAEIGAGVGGLCGVIGVLAGRRALQTWIKPKLLAASQNPTAVIEDKS